MIGICRMFSTHGYVGLEIDCCKFVGCICDVSDFVSEKFMLCFVLSIIHFVIFDFVLLHIVCGCLTDILIFLCFNTV